MIGDLSTTVGNVKTTKTTLAGANGSSTWTETSPALLGGPISATHSIDECRDRIVPVWLEWQDRRGDRSGAPSRLDVASGWQFQGHDLQRRQQDATDPALNIGQSGGATPDPEALDSGLVALAIIAGHCRVAADPVQLRHELGLGKRAADADDILLAARRLQLKARRVSPLSETRLRQMPLPAIVRSKQGRYAILAVGKDAGHFRLIDPVLRAPLEETAAALLGLLDGTAILVTLRLGGAGTDPRTFGFKWFLPSLWRYRQALVDVLVVRRSTFPIGMTLQRRR